MKYSLFVVIAIFATAVKCQNFTQVVQTDKGPIRGVIFKTIFNKKEYSAFISIPYAQPPVGDLRFKPPVEAEPWSDVMDATEDKAECPQMDKDAVVGSEDCLYLNVYTPLMDFNEIETLKAVLIWVPGGGFTSGSGAKSLYGPDSFIEEDVIMVDMNYRLNALGFLSLGIPGATGNQGLKDQNLVMQWVQKNIAKFGGDPNRVAIMGESAGAASVSHHIISPKSRGLFQKVIVHSGSSLAPWGYKTPAASKFTAYELAKRINITAKSDSDLLASLKEVDIKDLIPVATEMTNENLPVPMRIAFVPTSETEDDAFIDDCPISYFQSGNYNHVPMMFGYTAEETILYSIGLDNERYEIEQKLLGLTKVVDLTGHNNLMINIVNNVLNDTVWEIIKASSVYVFSGPMDLMQRFVAKNNGDLPVYFFRVSYRTKYSYHETVNPHINGTSHADDLVFFFPMPGNPTDPNHPFVVYSKKVVAMWANFVKYGNPTPDDSVGARWEPSGEQGLQMDIGNDGFIMKDRFIVSRDAEVMETYYAGLPVTSECKNYPFGAPSIY
ncbi:juvenile hormone esterase-like [Colletes gigas]|uniref:juvenile hormone esterase-like n=1 Tax=Colletes gigas TaxID=935657 RepID=UPI001C9A8EFD|nr:juvenile hormone esterase-like [Colletes gigas]